MPHTSTAVRRLAACLLILGAVLGTASAPAAASSSYVVDIRGLAVCDPAARQWVVTWEVTSRAETPGTIGNVRVGPPSRPLVGLPNRIFPGETIRGEQRLMAWEYSADITFDINWDDGPVTFDHHWPVYIKSWCAG